MAALTGLTGAVDVRAETPCLGRRVGDWTLVARPLFPGAETADPPNQTITSWAVDVNAPRRLFVSNGRQLLRSVDRGCTWSLVFELPKVPGADGLARDLHEITKVVLPEHRLDSRRVFLVLNRAGGSPGAPAVVRSSDDGESWSAATDGFAPGRASTLRIAASDGGVGYLTTGQNPVVRPALAGLLYRTEDGGETWTAPGGRIVDPYLGSLVADKEVYTDLEVDPTRAELVWAVRGGFLLRSVDGGETFDARRFEYPLGQLDVFVRPGEPGRVIVFAADGLSGAISEDGGRTFRDYRLPDVIVDATHAPGTGAVFLITERTVWGFDPIAGRWVDIRANVPGRLVEPYVSSAGNPQLVGRTVENFQFYLRTASPRAVGTPDLAFDFDLPVLPPPGISALLPAEVVVDVAPGGSTAVDYDLALPPTPSPVDVFFVIDTTSSMTPVIRGVQYGLVRIVQAITAARIDAQFGVAEFKDYPAPIGDSAPGERPYRRLREIGPADDELEDAVRSLRAEGGGPVLEEAYTTALVQAVTGAGEDVAPPGTSPGDTTPGQAAQWRPGATRIIVASTDHTWHKEPTYPGPTLPEAIDALVANRTAQIGLFAGADPAEADGLQLVAQATGALAASGVDCDQDGVDDIRPGEPLVCRVVASGTDTTGVGDTIVATIRALRDPSAVGLRATRGAAQVRLVSPAVRVVDAKLPIRERFQVTYTCRRDQAGQRLPVALEATVRGVRQLGVVAEVRCGSAPPVEIPPALERAVAVTVLPPGAPPAAVHVVSPQLQAQQQPQSQSQGQGVPQGAVAPEEQQEPELALAHADRDQSEQTLASTGLPPFRRTEPAAAFLAGAAGLTAAAGWALGRQRVAGVPVSVATTRTDLAQLHRRTR